MRSEADVKMHFKAFSEKHLPDLEEHLLSQFQAESETSLESSMMYSLDANGKRLRPLLLLAVLQSFGKDVTLGYPAASALEMIHTYSLIHDDLPAMDDDKLRRGKPTNHIQFDEATAILAGDALLTLAFEVITYGNLPAETKLALSKLLAETAGYRGMVGGQQADIEGEESDLSLAEIERIHDRKTGELIKMAVLSGGIIAGKNQVILDELAIYAREVGIAYQIRDDLLDQVGSEKELGKAVQSDTVLGKSTYPALLGLEGAFAALDERLEKAKSAIQSIEQLDSIFKSELLVSFLDQLTLEEYK